MNWRCIRHPSAGGVERLTQEVAARWVAQGHQVTLFTARYPGSLGQETIDGVRIVRAGGKYSVYVRAYQYYTSDARENFDVVIDEINTIPFFTPLYVKQPVVSVIYQLAREFWLLEVPTPFSWVGYVIEPWYLRIYRNVPTVTISESGRQDMVKLGFRNVSRIPVGISFEPLKSIPRPEDDPTILYIGRLERAKRPYDAIRAFDVIKNRLPNAKLWIIGDGPIRGQLEDLARQDVQFFGKVSDAQKLELMSRAHVLLVPYVREGWGLVVTEANACGTPAIGYNVPGLKDSIRHGETGLLTTENTPEALAQLTVELLQDDKLRHRLAQAALEWSREFTWDKTAEQFMRILDEVAEGRFN